MSRAVSAVLAWLDHRAGWRALRRHALDEPLPAGTGWWFTLGSVLLFGLGVQVVTGVALALFYAPTPDHAWNSVRYITTTVTGGHVLRGLHHWGASLVVVAAVAHLIRVVGFGSYRKPRELNWIVGLLLLHVILAFGLTGYLLPWDQRAYWATVVTINISRLTPVVGETVAMLLAGGTEIGAMTLTRWYAAHVVVLPIILAVLTVAHLALMRRHGISGPVRPRAGPSQPFFPYQAARDLTVVAVVAVLLTVLAWRGAPALEPPADPTSSDYIPRPEWYFLGLFQLLKYFPGRLEVVGAVVIPGLVMTWLMLLPWLDRGATRAWRDRRPVLSLFTAGMAVVATLTVMGALDRPAAATSEWNVQETSGALLLQSGTRCSRCHGPERVAAPIEAGTITRPPDWLAGHVADPIAIAPGVRDAPQTNEFEVAAIVAALGRMRAEQPPAVEPEAARALLAFNRECLACHRLDGVGGADGPDLSTIGSKATAADIERRVINPFDVEVDPQMPAFDGVLTPEEIRAVAAWLARRK